ncbi:MAG: DUF1573 domain-containing protein [Bacteroidales bacterium]|nr:DUF1573 domain-containing protein [Bacteroidales bacterium]MCF8344996.1 DUF1573 domain-containing protein [Bacteroidales bacterium]MCF8351709.1 DUF1573 domain-containing protein [Bacteroidales bacterium]MCF8377013.1 DUF1573 domain-containing protein [Bacteroidales bacterium]MCF8400908.1 DUF1573 domain-containing protein [Bacteroidales bacterium]
MKKLLILAVAIMFTAATAIGQDSKDENPNAPEISFDKTVHDYGTIYQGSDGTCEFEFTNTGKEPLILSKPRSSCGCTVPTWPKKPITAGQSEKIKVTYNTNRTGRFHKTVTVMSNAKTNRVVLTIKGNVVSKPKEELPEKNLDENSSPVNK